MKKSYLKIIGMALAAVMSMGMIAGCGSAPKSDNTTDNNTKNTATQSDIKTAQAGKLIMGTNAAFPPFEYVTSKGLVGEYDGIDVAIAKKIAEDMNVELVIEDMEFEGLIASVQTGKVDLVIAGMTVKPERQEKVDFSDTYFTAEQSIVVAKDNTDITKADDLKNNKKVGVVLGYTGDSIVTETLQVAENNILRVSRGIDAVQELKNGKLDAVVIDSATAQALASKNDLKIVKDEAVFEAEEYAIAVKKGNSGLVQEVNKVLKKMKDSGEIDQLAQKYNSEVEAPAQ